MLVLVRGHQRQRAHRLALRTRADDAHLARRVPAGFFDVDDRVRGHVEQAELTGHRDVVHHRSAEERDLAATTDRGVRDLLDAVQVRSEAGDDQAAIGVLAHERPHRVTHRRLRRGEARPFRVGRVGEQQPDATVHPRDLAEEREVRVPPVDRCEVELEVAGVDDRAGGREERGGEAVRHRVRDGDELAVERSDAAALAVEDGNERRPVDQTRFLDAIARHRERQRGAVDLQLHLAQQEREPAGVVLVRVGEEHAFDAIRVVAHVGEIGKHEVDAGHVLVGEHEPAVDQQDPVIYLEAQTVAPDLTEPTQEHDANDRVTHPPDATAGCGGRRHCSRRPAPNPRAGRRLRPPQAGRTEARRGRSGAEP